MSARMSRSSLNTPPVASKQPSTHGITVSATMTPTLSAEVSDRRLLCTSLRNSASALKADTRVVNLQQPQFTDEFPMEVTLPIFHVLGWILIARLSPAE